jgi:hypothetical protein
MSEEVAFSLVLNVEDALTKLNKVNAVMSQTLGLIRRATGDENIQKAASNTQRLISIMNEARITAIALRGALFLGTGPLGAALAGVSLGATAMNVLEYSGQDTVHDATWGT